MEPGTIGAKAEEPVPCGVRDKGSYLAEEITPPQGFILSSDVSKVRQPFVWDGEHDISLIFENSSKVKVQLKKVDESGSPLAGAIFIVLRDGQIIATEETGPDGTITVSNVVEGHYEFVEVAAPSGFDCDKTPVGVHVNAEDLQGEQTIVVEKMNHHKRSLTITKRDTETGEPVPNTSFHIRGVNLGYVLNSTPQTIIVKNGSNAVSSGGTTTDPGAGTNPGGGVNGGNDLVFENDPIGTFELIKVDAADKTKRLGGVAFEIRKMDDTLVETVSTGSDGRVSLKLDAGDYYALEIEAKEGYKLDSARHYFTMKNGKNTTLTVTNAAFSGVILHKINSVTKEGIYGVKFLVYDQNKNPIGEYTTDDNGYIYIDDLTVQGKGRLYIRELEAAPGYELDKEYKTVYVQPGKTIEVEWENTPITGQFQIRKYAAEYNEVTGTAAGAPLQGAVYEISEARSGKVVDYITTDARGVAASKPLPLGRYLIKEVTAPAYWQLSATTFDETLEYSGQIIKLCHPQKRRTPRHPWPVYFAGRKPVSDSPLQTSHQ